MAGCLHKAAPIVGHLAGRERAVPDPALLLLRAGAQHRLVEFTPGRCTRPGGDHFGTGVLEPPPALDQPRHLCDQRIDVRDRDSPPNTTVTSPRTPSAAHSASSARVPGGSPRGFWSALGTPPRGAAPAAAHRRPPGSRPICGVTRRRPRFAPQRPSRPATRAGPLVARRETLKAEPVTGQPGHRQAVVTADGPGRHETGNPAATQAVTSR